MSGLRVMVYDSTDWAGGSLTKSWFAGGKLYKLFRALDLVHPAKSWDEAFQWLNTISPDQKIDVWQFWGHGSTAKAFVDGVALGASSLKPGGPFYDELCALKERLHPGSLVWFRTCNTFHGEAGKRLAKDLSNFLNCRVAAHTFIIGPFQSGLHSIGPGEEPSWDDSEGLDESGKAKMSMPWDKNTVTCLHGFIPKGW